MARKSEKIAYHEAGHAVVARALGIEVNFITTFSSASRSEANSHIKSAAHGSREADAATLAAAFEKDAIVALAGPTAQAIFCPKTDHRRACKDEWRSDYENAEQFTAGAVIVRKEGKIPAQKYVLDKNDLIEVNGLFERLCIKASVLIEENRRAIERVANALLIRPQMNQDELDALIALTGT